MKPDEDRILYILIERALGENPNVMPEVSCSFAGNFLRIFRTELSTTVWVKN